MKNKRVFCVGDRVGLLHEKGEGTVVEVRGAIIRLELDDFMSPCDYPSEQLYLLKPAEPLPAKSLEFPSQLTLPPALKYPGNIALLRYSGAANLAIFVFNQSENTLSAQWFLQNQKKSPWIWQAEFKVQPGKGLLLMTQDHFSSSVMVRVQGFYNGNAITPKGLVDEQLALQSDLSDAFWNTLGQGLEFIRPAQPKPGAVKDSVAGELKRKQASVPPQLPYILDEELDLHAENCIPGYRSMTASEILEQQKEIALKAIFQGQTEQWNSLTLIHGIGKGVLKNEVIKLIKKQRLPFTEQAHGGALRINFRGSL